MPRHRVGTDTYCHNRQVLVKTLVLNTREHKNKQTYIQTYQKNNNKIHFQC